MMVATEAFTIAIALGGLSIMLGLFGVYSDLAAEASLMVTLLSAISAGIAGIFSGATHHAAFVAAVYFIGCWKIQRYILYAVAGLFQLDIGTGSSDDVPADPTPSGPDLSTSSQPQQTQRGTGSTPTSPSPHQQSDESSGKSFQIGRWAINFGNDSDDER